MVARLFVGNLPWTIGRQQLREYFSQFGRVSNSVVHFDRNSGFSKGFGFVTFSNEESVSAVLSCKDHEFEGQKLNIHLTDSSSNQSFS